MTYVFFRQLFRIFFTLFYRWKITGADHVLQEGSVIICSNHISNLDPPLVGSSLKRGVHFMAKEELFKNPVFSFFMKKFLAFPVKRAGGGKQALKHSIRLIKENQAVGIFPEGTRSKTGRLGKAHIGAALIALKTQTPIVPVAIIGPYRLFRPLHVVFGEPIRVETDTSGKGNAKSAQELTDQVMGEIQALQDRYST